MLIENYNKGRRSKKQRQVLSLDVVENRRLRINRSLEDDLNGPDLHGTLTCPIFYFIIFSRETLKIKPR